jgi:protein gp37/ParB-like chromosome segregation protein Spo0J
MHMDGTSVQQDGIHVEAMPVIPPDEGMVEQCDPRILQPHHLNKELYGEEIDAGLRASIALYGILTPLLVTHNRVIISGHRRHAVALELGLPMVPVIVSPLTDPLEIEEAVIRANIARTKTHYQQAREYQRLKPIQAELAKHRQRQAAVATNHQLGRHVSTESLMGNLAEASTKGEARALAAEMLGLKRSSAEKALQVVEAIDRAMACGHREDAERLIAYLNKSILRGYKSAHALGYIAEEQIQTAMTKLPHCTWAHWQWDPVTGCQGTCAYCSARDLAHRTPAAFVDRTAPGEVQASQLADPFAPRLHAWRLQAPLQTRVSDGEESVHYRILTGWQGDIFGPWVPQEWIDQVVDTVRTSAVQGLPWQYLFLTKYPARLLEIDWPANAWVGVTVDRQERVWEAEETLRELKQHYPSMVTYLVCEPLREALRFTSLKICNWLLVGGQGRTATAPEVQPLWHWVLALLAQAACYGCRVVTHPTLKTVWPQQELDGDETIGTIYEAMLEAISPLMERDGEREDAIRFALE